MRSRALKTDTDIGSIQPSCVVIPPPSRCALYIATIVVGFMAPPPAAVPDHKNSINATHPQSYFFPGAINPVACSSSVLTPLPIPCSYHRPRCARPGRPDCADRSSGQQCSCPHLPVSPGNHRLLAGEERAQVLLQPPPLGCVGGQGWPHTALGNTRTDLGHVRLNFEHSSKHWQERRSMSVNISPLNYYYYYGYFPTVLFSLLYILKPFKGYQPLYSVNTEFSYFNENCAHRKGYKT